MLTSQELRERAEDLADRLKVPQNGVAEVIAEWAPPHEKAAIASSRARKAVFRYSSGIVFFEWIGDERLAVRSETRSLGDVDAVLIRSPTNWYTNFRVGGLKEARAWSNGEKPAEGLLRFKTPLTDVGNDDGNFEFPLDPRNYDELDFWKDLRNSLLS